MNTLSTAAPILFAATAASLLCLPTVGDETATTTVPAPAAASPAAIVAAADRGLDWLAAAQQADGSWGSGGFQGSAAVTAQGLLALLGSGSTPTAGPHAQPARRAADFLRRCCRPDGLIAGNEAAAHGPMYSHAYATLALAECCGEVVDPDLRRQLRAAGQVIAGSQHAAGGWRYQPVPTAGDVSVTAAMLVAIRGLVEAGIDVDAAVADRASDFIARLQNPDGGFRYLAEPGPSAAPRTAAAVFALQLAGVRGEPIRRGLQWLDQHPLTLDSDDGYAVYGLAAAAAARWQQRLATGDAAVWDAWFSRVAATLLAAQQDDGSWTDPSCPEYGTAAVVTILQTPAGLLPIVAAEGERAGGRE